MKKSLYFILITLFIFGSCTKKSTVTKTTSTGSSTIDSGGSSGSGSSGSVGSNDSQECGVKTGNDEIDDQCYYTVSPDLIAHGNPISGTFYYHTSLHATEIPQARFNSDQKFQIRIMPKMASQSQQTTGRTPYRT